MHFFSHKKICDSLYLIYESYAPDQSFTLPLVIGTEKAALLDSGLGADNGLRRYVETLTDRPVINIVTHGHPDHAGASILFDQRYMSKLDDPELPWSLAKERRLSDLVDFSRHNEVVMAWCAEHAVDCTGYTHEDLNDGDTFELGGITLEIIATPGHTAGSMSVVNRAQSWIFLGDAVSTRVMLTDRDIRRIEASRNGLARVAELAKEIPGLVLYPAHSKEPVPIEMVIALRDLCDEVLSGTTQNDPVGHFKFAEMNDPDIRLRLHEKNGIGIMYNVAAVEHLWKQD